MNKFNIDPFDGYGFRLSWAKKKANDFQWAKDMADFYDGFYSFRERQEDKRRLKINYDLFNGRSPNLEEYRNFFSQYNYGEDGKYSEMIAQYDQIEHHPIIDQIAKAMVGERRRRRINAKVKDMSLTAKNQRKAKQIELIKQLFKTTIIDPMRAEVLKSMNKDGKELTPEQAQELQAQADQQAQTMILEEINDFVNNDFYLPTDVEGQRMLEHWMNVNDVENITVEGFKHALITGKEVYRLGIRNFKPFMELTNPMGLTYYLSPNKHNIEDAEWVKYEQDITVPEFFDMFGNVLKPKHLKKLDALVEVGGRTTGRNTNIESQLVSVVSNDPRVRRGEIDQRNAAGQEYLKSVYGGLKAYNSKTILRHVHIVFIAQRMMYYVYRTNEEGKLVHEWFDEHYTPSKLNGDISWKIVWVNQIWQVDKIGDGDDAIYLNVGPVEGQYLSPDDPFNPKMPYIGSEYSRLMGNSRNVAIMDLGKPWQYKFNVQMARLQEMDATDLGNVLLMVQQAIPKDWDPIDFYGYLKHYKIGLLDLQQEGVGPNDVNAIKNVDLSNRNEKQNTIAYLEFLKDNIAKSMYYNPSRLGQISPYLPVTNNQQNILQSSAQTEDIYSIHNSIIERALNALVDNARLCYYMNPKEYEFILDDAQAAHLDVSEDLFKNAKLGVKVANQSEDDINMQAIKEFIPYFLQTDKIDFEDTAKLLWAKNGSEILNIAKKGDKKAENKAQAAAQNEQQLLAQKAEQDERLLRLEAQLALMTQAVEHDTNRNNLNDKIEREIEKIKYARDNDEKNRQSAERIAAMQARIEEKKIAAQERMNAYTVNNRPKPKS